MNNWRRFSILAMIFLVFNSCVDQISFPLDRGVEKLIVYGQLSNLDEDKFVFLSETTSADREPLFAGQYLVLNDLPRPVTTAQVFVVNTDNQRYLLNQIEPGKYMLPRNVEIREDVSYFVEILIDGRVYRSEPEQMPQVVGEDELGYTFSRGNFEGAPETAFISIVSDVQLPTADIPYFLRWDVDEAYYWNLTFFPNPFNRAPPDCYVFGFPDPERITLFNGENAPASGQGGSQIVAERIVDESFLSRHYFNVRQVSTTRGSHDYWRRIRELVNNSGSVFDTPPAPVRGNVKNISDPDEVVLGYFEVVRVSQNRIYTTRADVPFFIPEVCTYDPARPLDKYPRTCLRCSEFPNSTTQTPHWWFDQ
ncbi:DUF4249 domain-containing protein [Algoriphagus kandeliae]|uniref:DUF4249 domain-containing protein n=1 Tax=Algoriphagus kandeliae TaxID=2562278 RepID=A0A4Y9QYJ2_9BACT|nr:DUF4249 family protein [Algoriphagus kandeliae]TFV96135.1 DUF4249 domain-containing protein [Algoriphagus kandeliae]